MLDPIWNKYIHESDRAMDPLGLDRVADRVINELLVGITTLTPRARYYSFYTWVINYINNKKSIKTFAQFCNEFYKIERIYMLSCIAHEKESKDEDSHHSINGSLKGRRVLNEDSDPINLNFKYFGNQLGGYGQYYSSSMRNLKLIKISKDSSFESPTEFGLKISEAFENVVKLTDFGQNWFQKDIIPKEELIKFGNAICVCKLKNNEANERDLLRDLFFGTFLNVKLNKTIITRRNALLLFLFCINFADQNGIKLTDQELLNSCYFRQIYHERIYNIEFPQNLIEVANQFKNFRIHDYFAYSIETLLSCFLQFLNEKSIGRTIDEFLDKCITQEYIESLLKLTDIKISELSPNKIPLLQFLDEITSKLGIGKFSENEIKVSQNFNSNVGIDSKFSEFNQLNLLKQITSKKKYDPHDIFPVITIILSTLYLRFFFMKTSNDNAWSSLIFHTRSDLSPVEFIKSLNKKLRTESFSLADFQKWLIDDYVIKQTFKIYEEKSANFQKPRTWFHPEKRPYYKWDRDYAPRLRNSRFNSVTSILIDLGILEYKTKEKLTLHDDGKEILKEFLEVD